ncbi:MAG TPA: 3-oxoacyl-ACP reductase [Anaerolinea thermolimosa]|uniref:3-oxoacyl-ACP reductase n=1 Tax=Anaerolinea thermolimosa TaxID=229919 RepID=A0A3D1JEY9_9CHLR|nr:glucose 1-dehydrogenase [Anaerolinea thermolimosa]GAP05605.1 dehydrogenase related to short-chain alcohol dehydrogenases [Anaerolinea thermolimosa]HCE16785.1 3-oxoacyl-ACP reductase [Anaerolinea thermolimosa]
MSLPIDLSGKCVLVTGGNTGIGAEISRTLAAAGARVAIDYVILPERAQRLVEDLNQKYAPGTAIAIEGSIAEEDSARQIVDTVVKSFGRLDVLVNNAALESVFPALDLPLAEWDRILNVNLRGTFIMSRTAARQMVAQGNGGVIINIQSIHDLIARKGAVHYCVSKAGVAMLTKMLALEWAEYGIRVVGVSPGAIAADRGTPAGPPPPDMAEFLNQFNEWIPLGRFGKPQEVANAVAFLASDLASYCTGTTLYVDGAYSINLVRYDQRQWLSRNDKTSSGIP